MITTLTNPLTNALRKSLRNARESIELPAESGVHIDPVDTPAPRITDPERRILRESPEMRWFQRALQLGDRDVRTSVLDDLATYHGCTPEEARLRALHWEADSLAEWQAVDGSGSDDGRVAFYRTQQSWSYDLLWWAYLQAEGYADPASVMAYRWLQQHCTDHRHLDFGSGVGTTSQLFIEGGWTSGLADLSSTLLDFARFRLERRGEKAEYIDLAEGGLPAGSYGAITAIDTLAHVPDLYVTGRQLHDALSPGGYLIANFDIRKPKPETAWHLYTDDLTAEYDLRRAGFRRVAELGYDLVAYQKVPVGQLRGLARTTWDWLTLVSPVRRASRRGLGRAVALASRLRGR